MTIYDFQKARELLVRLHPFLMAQHDLYCKGVPFAHAVEQDGADFKMADCDEKSTLELLQCISEVGDFLRANGEREVIAFLSTHVGESVSARP